jgi:hypothetical protein
VLDPFVGTGTTLVECKKYGVKGIGIDANPVTVFASQVKTKWDLDLTEFERRQRVVLSCARTFNQNTVYQPTFDEWLHPSKVSTSDVATHEAEIDLQKIQESLPKNWMNTHPLSGVVNILTLLSEMPDDPITHLLQLAVIAVAVNEASNISFGPEVYVSQKLLKSRQQVDLATALSKKFAQISQDLLQFQQLNYQATSEVYCGDARQLQQYIDQPVNFVITSPPYPNEKDYTRITRLELILMGWMQNKQDLRYIKQAMLRSHTRNIFTEDNDSNYVNHIPEIRSLAEAIEAARIKKGATSGFERLYHRVVTEYFGGMYRVFQQLRELLVDGGKIALVVGDQMSYFRVPIYTAQLLSLIACREFGYREIETRLWRTRYATASQTSIEEHILILQK